MQPRGSHNHHRPGNWSQVSQVRSSDSTCMTFFFCLFVFYSFNVPTRLPVCVCVCVWGGGGGGEHFNDSGSRLRTAVSRQ